MLLFIKWLSYKWFVFHRAQILRPHGINCIKVSFLFINYTLLFHEIRTYSSLSTIFFLSKYALAAVKARFSFSLNIGSQSLNCTLLSLEIRAYSSLSTIFFLVKHRLAVTKLHPTVSRNMPLCSAHKNIILTRNCPKISSVFIFV